MSVRFLTSWNGYQPGDVATFSGQDGEPVESDLIDGGLARDAAENDNTTPNLTDRVTTLETDLTILASDFADDAAAEAGGIPVGNLYHNSGAVLVRLT
jgi:hypothetical protein